MTKTSTDSFLRGILSVHPRGFGFVHPEGASDSSQDVFIPPRYLEDAVDGDLVEVELAKKPSSPKGRDGKVLSVIQRSKTHLAGIIIGKEDSLYTAYVPLLGPTKKVRVESRHPLQIGDRLTLKVLKWKTSKGEILCEAAKLIGPLSDPSCDVAAAIEEFQLLQSFSSEVNESVSHLGTRVKAKDLQGRINLTDLITVTIDPTTARDFDDALSLTKDEKGNYFLGVHIADAAHYVRSNSSLDSEAFLRCNSTYFPGQSIPMLPPELSHHLCSLKPDTARLTISLLMQLDSEGNCRQYEIVRSYIKSRRRFTYEQAFALLQSQTPKPYSALLNDMAELALLLKKKRMDRGSINLALEDSEVEVNSQGEPLRVKKIEYDLSHQLVEEFMLKANEIVATHLNKKGKILIYRIHEAPSLETFQDFYSLVRALGFPLPESPSHLDIQRLFEEVKGSPFQQLLSVQFIKSMRIAYYSPDNVGHYGLALDHYCHFTSPIRRYSDLITQRLIFDEESPSQNLSQIASICSEKERISMRAENAVVQLKKMRLLQKFFSDNPTRIYPARITGVKSHILIFELVELGLEGTIHVSQLEADYFVFEPHMMRWKGVRTGKIYLLGDMIDLMVVRMDLALQTIDWIAEEKPSRKNKKKK